MGYTATFVSEDYVAVVILHVVQASVLHQKLNGVDLGLFDVGKVDPVGAHLHPDSPELDVLDPAAHPVRALHHQHVGEAVLGQPPGSGDPGHAGPEHQDVGGEGLHRGVRPLPVMAVVVSVGLQVLEIWRGKMSS